VSGKKESTVFPERLQQIRTFLQFLAHILPMLHFTKDT